jgi:uncharacterized repeat protein (TIGR01451 family)
VFLRSLPYLLKGNNSIIIQKVGLMKKKRYLHLIAVMTIVGVLSSLWLLVQSKADDPDPKSDNQIFLPFITTDGNATPATDITEVKASLVQIAQGNAAGGRIDAFTFFIPYAATAMAAQFDVGSNTVGPNLDIVTSISIAVNRDGAVIYYDQWEDTLEGDLTLPTQITTLVWGDGDPSNNNTGLAPGAQVQGIPANDILRAGTVITLRNTVPSTLAGRGTPPTIFFDGGDMLTSVGGAIAVSTMFWTAPPGPSILFTDSWELYPTNRWGTVYISPIGQNVNRDGPANRGEFQVVGLNVQAVENATRVDVDLNNDGTPEQTQILNQGEQLSLANGVLAGTRVEATGPVQVHLFESDPDSTWEARGYTLVPFEQWTNDYLAPRASDGDFWLYNPTTNPITITVQSATNTTALSILGNSAARYPVTTPPFDDNNADDVDMSGATGLRFTSNGPSFYGMVALDSADTQDWGYDVLPIANLTSQALVGLGPGNVNSPGCPPNPTPLNNGREGRIYVTVLSATTLLVDVNNDGTPDNVDITGDGIADPSPYALSPLQEVSITDPSDCDMTGAFLYTPDGTPFASAWGQDASASPALPSIDAGTSIVPLRSLALQKTFALLTDVDCTGSISVGDAVRFQLQYLNDSATLLNSVVVTDTLPTELAYIPNSTTQNGLPVADGGGNSPYPLDGSGLNTGPLNGFSDGVLTFDTTVSGPGGVIINRASASSPSLPLQGDAVTIFVPTGNITPVLQITESLIDPASGPISVGQVVTFSLNITNTGSTTVTILPVQQDFNASHLTFLNATPAATIASTGVITWDDLTAIFGDLTPGQAVNVLLNFSVAQIPAGNRTSLAALITGARQENSPVLLRCRGEATASFFPPPPTPTPTKEKDKGGNPQKTPTPIPPPPPATPTPASVAVVPAPPTGTALPVTFLPETGLRETGAEAGWPTGVALLSAPIAALALLWFWKKRAK